MIPAWHIHDLITVELAAIVQENPALSPSISKLRDWTRELGNRAAKYEAEDIKWQAKILANRLSPERHK